MSLMTNFGQTASLLLGLPFDLARFNYAQAVRLGFVEHSLLKSARFAQELRKIEQLTLGPWARQV
ncbi:hypothetical protein [Rhodoferax sp.]|uniref:hypothetical protein n=1 Tax=Rhodoferax sp. TaxID=50421 RepID=UPI00283B79BA|nr:hypothetical protein [Rhodoferax sp.]MDR3370477.1 hypothetical protein [Rhodoferax sp.]